MSHALLSTTLAVLALTLALAGAARAELTLHVAVDGDDAATGSATDPLASLEGARDRIRQLRAEGADDAFVVEVAAGEYAMAGPLRLSSEDGGAPDAPVTYRAQAGAEVRISGGRRVTGWNLVTDEGILGRLPEEARGHVYSADLAALGIRDYGSPVGHGLEVFYRDEPMSISRWPNEGFVRIARVLGEDPVDVRGTVGDQVGKFVYEGDRPERWVDEADPWVHGYWFWDWSDQRQPVASIDTEQRIIEVEPPYHVYGYREGQWFYAYNLLAEIDEPGEWYLDRDAGVLYLYPTGDLGDGDVMVSVLADLIIADGAANIALEGFVLEGVRSQAVRMEGCTECSVAGCTIRNGGGGAVRVNGGEGVRVVDCDVMDVGQGGIALSGGDRATLTPAGHAALNNHIQRYGRWDRMYQTGISLSGVGQRAANNLIHDAPHMAIGFDGNDHVIELNEIHDVCYESNDAGAIYAGRDWSMRGTVIRHNYFHDITGFEGRGCVGVYLDDMWCGTQVEANLFVRVTRAAMIGGGRDNAIVNNIFVNCQPSVHVDGRAMNWASYHVDTTMTERLEAMPYQEEPWATRYPELLTILEDEPAAPKGNLIDRNIIIGEDWNSIYEEAEPYVAFVDNLVNVEVGMADPAAGDFTLAEDSPAWELGFEPIPYEAIGLRPRPYR